MQARGLKQYLCLLVFFSRLVAPHAGAWIETFVADAIIARSESRLMQARGLKPRTNEDLNSHLESRLMQARGLKH